MRKASWKALLITGLLTSSAGLADDAIPYDDDAAQRPTTVPKLNELAAKSAYAERWALPHSDYAAAYSADWSNQIAALNFQDPSAMARVSKFRSLSLLTLAHTGQTRLFLGVNEKGLLGLHFRAFARSGDEQCLEMVRMPYLKDSDTDGNDSPSDPELN